MFGMVMIPPINLNLRVDALGVQMALSPDAAAVALLYTLAVRWYSSRPVRLLKNLAMESRNPVPGLVSPWVLTGSSVGVCTEVVMATVLGYVGRTRPPSGRDVYHRRGRLASGDPEPGRQAEGYRGPPYLRHQGHPVHPDSWQPCAACSSSATGSGGPGCERPRRRWGRSGRYGSVPGGAARRCPGDARSRAGCSPASRSRRPAGP